MKAKDPLPHVAAIEEQQRNSAFDRRRRLIGAICGPICALLVWLTPISSLSPEAHRLLAIMTLVCLWWITEPVPIPVTSLVGPSLCVIFGVVKMKEAFAAYHLSVYGRIHYCQGHDGQWH